MQQSDVGPDVGSWAGPLAAIDQHARLRLLWLVAAVLAVCTASGVQALRLPSHDGYILAVLLHGLAYCAAVWVVATSRLPRNALLWIILIACALRVIVFLAPVGLTTDAYRYVWDGRLHVAGVNPYETVPADPRLAHLQDKTIFPNINGKDDYPTIYPPVAQLAFLLATRLHDSIDGVKLLMAACEAGIVLALLGWLAAARLPRERVLIYAWHPLPMWEFTGHGHIDAVAVLAVTLAFWAIARGRSGWAGAAFAAAALVKYWPVYLAAAVWRRWDWRFIAGGAALAVLVTLPYVAPNIIGYGFPAVTPAKLLGSLFKHLDAEGYNREGWGFFVAYAPKHFGWWVIEGTTYAKLAAAALVALAAWVVLAADRTPWLARQGNDPTPGLLPIILITAFLLLISPHYPWYYAMAVPLLARCLYVPLLFVTLAVTMIYIEIDYVWLLPYPRFKVYCLLYGGFLVLAAAIYAWRRPIR
jgi:alpha-1,6-mannosyltransferase